MDGDKSIKQETFPDLLRVRVSSLHILLQMAPRLVVHVGKSIRYMEVTVKLLEVFAKLS